MVWGQALSSYASFLKYRTFWSVTHLVRMYSNVNGVTHLNLLPLSSFSSSSSSSSLYTTVPICLLAHVAMIESLISGNVYNENRFEISTRLIRFRLRLHYPLVMITCLYLNFDFPGFHLLLYHIPLQILFIFILLFILFVFILLFIRTTCRTLVKWVIFVICLVDFSPYSNLVCDFKVGWLFVWLVLCIIFRLFCIFRVCKTRIY